MEVVSDASVIDLGKPSVSNNSDQFVAVMRKTVRAARGGWWAQQRKSARFNQAIKDFHKDIKTDGATPDSVQAALKKFLATADDSYDVKSFLYTLGAKVASKQLDEHNLKQVNRCLQQNDTEQAKYYLSLIINDTDNEVMRLTACLAWKEAGLAVAGDEVNDYISLMFGQMPENEIIFAANRVEIPNDTRPVPTKSWPTDMQLSASARGIVVEMTAESSGQAGDALLRPMAKEAIGKKDQAASLALALQDLGQLKAVLAETPANHYEARFPLLKKMAQVCQQTGLPDEHYHQQAAAEEAQQAGEEAQQAAEQARKNRDRQTAKVLFEKAGRAFYNARLNPSLTSEQKVVLLTKAVDNFQMAILYVSSATPEAEALYGHAIVCCNAIREELKLIEAQGLPYSFDAAEGLQAVVSCCKAPFGIAIARLEDGKNLVPLHQAMHGTEQKKLVDIQLQLVQEMQRGLSRQGAEKVEVLHQIAVLASNCATNAWHSSETLGMTKGQALIAEATAYAELRKVLDASLRCPAEVRVDCLYSLQCYFTAPGRILNEEMGVTTRECTHLDAKIRALQDEARGRTLIAEELGKARLEWAMVTTNHTEKADLCHSAAVNFKALSEVYYWRYAREEEAKPFTQKALAAYQQAVRLHAQTENYEKQLRSLEDTLKILSSPNNRWLFEDDHKDESVGLVRDVYAWLQNLRDEQPEVVSNYRTIDPLFFERALQVVLTTADLQVSEASGELVSLDSQ